ncbi:MULTISPECIES: hypothetical protein [unclassified Thermococcus]|uniref:hypothetical protein n=1 Tax=unclassified Thermococcus TaxID=2627626 RepID=UPI00143B353A|nr:MULTISPECIES: hypothetical protein [unclassified Thermococcus]
MKLTNSATLLPSIINITKRHAVIRKKKNSILRIKVFDVMLADIQIPPYGAID